MLIQDLNIDNITLKDLRELKAYDYKSFMNSYKRIDELSLMNTKKIRAKFIEMFNYGLALESELHILRKFTYKLLKKNVELNNEINDYQMCIDELDNKIAELQQ